MPVTVGGNAISPSQAEQLRVALGVDGTPVIRRLIELTNTVDFIGIDGTGPALVAASVIADYAGSPPAATAPSTMTVGQWTAEATLVAGQMGINIVTLPSDGGSAITALEYRVGTGAAIALSGTGTGLRTVTAGFSAGVAADIQVRAVNAVDAGAWSDTKNRTPLAGGGGAAAYIAHTLASGAGSVVGTLPAGVTASDTLLAIVYNTGGTGTIETMAAPSGWTARTGVVENARGARAFTAPGNVGTLTFTAAGAERLVLIGLSAPLRDHAFAAWDFDTPGQIINQPTPSVTAVLNDVCVSVYIQVDDGAGGALPSPGAPQASYTRQLLDNTAAPRVSILSRASMPAGATGTISHDANANFATRFTFTGVFGS